MENIIIPEGYRLIKVTEIRMPYGGIIRAEDYNIQYFYIIIKEEE